MSAQAEIPRGHPMRDAWEAYKATAEYANSRNWALKEAHVDGSMWAAFCAGYKATAADAAVGAQGDDVSITVTVKDGEWTGTLEEWRQRPRSVVYRGPAAAGAQGDGENWLSALGALVCAGKDRDASREDQEADINKAHAELYGAIRRLAAPAAGKGVDDVLAIVARYVGKTGSIYRYIAQDLAIARVGAELADEAALTRQPVAGEGVNGRAWKVGDRVIWTSRFGKPFAGTVTCVRDPIPVRYEVELDDGALCDPFGHELTAG